MEALEHLVRAVPLLECGPDCEADLDCALRSIAACTWRLAIDPARPREDYELALRAAELHVARRPEVVAVVSTVGVLQYRLERHEEAILTLARSDEEHRTLYEGGLPADVAFVAMARARLGNEDGARAALSRLRDLVDRPEHTMNQESRSFLGEAEAIIEGRE